MIEHTMSPDRGTPQGKISEVELRLYLAGQGAGSADVNKV